MLVVITILCMITTWTVSHPHVPLYYDGEFVDFMVCRGTDHPTDPYDCSTEDPCNEANAAETCQDLGDGINRCYWTDEDVIQIGSMTLADHGDAEYIDRICTHDGDAECALLDGTAWYEQDGFGGAAGSGDSERYYTSCLRCCPNEATGLDLCTETISTNEPGSRCGTIGNELFFWSHQYHPVYGYFGNIAPCCAGEVCLDETAGLCGVAGQACDSCTIWSYIIDATQDYHTGHSCDAGLTCLDDGSEPLIKYKPIPMEGEFDPEIPDDQPPRRLFDEGDESIFDALPREVQHRHRRLQPSFDQIIYHRGTCVPLESVGTCDHDSDCADCMRCCGGKCKRIAVSTDSEMCGFAEGRGPCCKGFQCCDNECVTPAPTRDGDDDDDDDDDDDE